MRRAGLVQVVAGQVAALGQLHLVVANAFDPAAHRLRLRAHGQAVDDRRDIRRNVDACIDQACQQHAQPQHMHVGVIEAGDQRMPSQVDMAHPRALQCGARAKCGDAAVVADQHRLGVGQAGINGVDDPVGE